MAQQVIDGILYSPVNAHALRKGDLIHIHGGTSRLTANPTLSAHAVHTPIVLVDGSTPGTVTSLRLWTNEPVMRAVGARCGGVL